MEILTRLPTVDLGCLVVYDAFAIRALRRHVERKQLPQVTADSLAHDTFRAIISSSPPFYNDVADKLGRALWPLFVKEPPAPEIDDDNYVPAVWRYIIVPSALISAAVCLDYWTGQAMRNLSIIKVGGQVVGCGTPYPVCHAEEYVRSKQVLFEVLGDTEARRYADALASKRSPKMWLAELRRVEARTQSILSDLGYSYEGLGFLRWPYTAADDDHRLMAWLIDTHFRHPTGSFFRPPLREPTAHDYGGACATTYALMLSWLYKNTKRLAEILPPVGTFITFP